MTGPRGLVLLVSLIAAIGAASHAQEAAPQPPNPFLPAPYRLVLDWPPPDPGLTLGAAYQVQPDAQGNLWVAHRGTPPIVRIDPRSGKVLGGFGEGMFVGLHGLTIDSGGNIYVADCPGGRGFDEAALKSGTKGYQVFKFSPDGTLLMTLGRAGVSRPGRDTFSCPTDVVVGSNGDIFVTDGHDGGPNHYGDRVAKFSRHGTFIKNIAESGSAPGQVWEPHGITIDSQARLFVGDRGNNRIQIFDQEGGLIDMWKQFSRPGGLYVDTRTDTLYVSDANSNAQNHPDWGHGIRIGSAKSGALHYFIPGTDPEGVAVDADGNVFAAITRVRLEKWEKLVR